MIAPTLSRPLIVASGLWLAIVVHGFVYFLWLNIDHHSAFLWMNTLGDVVFTHCFGDSGWLSHGPEIAAVSFRLGGILGVIGLPISAVALMRARDRLSRTLASSLLGTYFFLVATHVVLFRDADAHAQTYVRETNARVLEARQRQAK